MTNIANSPNLIAYCAQLRLTEQLLAEYADESQLRLDAELHRTTERAASAVVLDLTFTSGRAGGYSIDLRVTLPGSAVAVAPLAAPVSVAFDRASLHRLTLDSVAYGAALGSMLFASAELHAGIAQARAVAGAQGLPLRLRLAIGPDAAELHALRWECLASLEAVGGLSAPGSPVQLSRMLPSADWQPVRRHHSGKLRALALVAAPIDLPDYGLAPLDAPCEIARLSALLGGWAPTTMGAGVRADVSGLFQQLQMGCDLLLVLAHGRADEGGQTWLYLEDQSGRTAPLPGQELIARLAVLAEKPRLVILAACESAGDGSGAVVAALGPQLVRAGVPAVLAMQGRISRETLERFLAVCLHALQQDARIDRAVALARSQVCDRPDWWVPTLWVCTSDDVLWHKPPPVFVGTPPDTLTARQRGELLERLALSYRERLANVLAHQVRLQLGLHTRPDAVDPSWRRMHLCGPAETRPVPDGTPLLELFDSQAGQLLVLGAPGAGKTTLMVELAQTLLARAQADRQARIPVLLNVAAWRSGQSMRFWLAATLSDWLGTSKRFATQLAAGDALVLLLDGLDEVAEQHRAACVEAINAFLHERDLAPPLVVGCRSRAYAEIKTRLRITGAVELEPLSLAAVERALAGVPAAQGVLDALHSDGLLRGLAHTPLMINVLLLAHAGREVPQVRIGSLEERRAMLWQAYVRRMLQQRGLVHWSPAQVLEALRWLACLLRAQNTTNFLVDTLQPAVLSSVVLRYCHRCLGGVALTLTVFLVGWLTLGLLVQLVGWLVPALILGIVAGLGAGLCRSAGAAFHRREKPHWSWAAFWRHLRHHLKMRPDVGLNVGLLGGLLSGLGLGMVGGLLNMMRVGLIAGLGEGLVVTVFGGSLGALGVGLAVGLASWLLDGWQPSDLPPRAAPMQDVYASVETELHSGLGVGLIGGLAFGLIFGLLLGLVVGLGIELLQGMAFGVAFGLALGLAFGLSFGLAGALEGVIRHYALRFVLACAGLFPFRAVTFLEEMCTLLLLERDGALYRFRHLLLRDFFAELSDAEIALLARGGGRGICLWPPAGGADSSYPAP